jgi:hypothetical protein
MVVYVDIYVALYNKCRNTIRKSINGRVIIREAVERSVAQIRKCYRGQESIASDFSFRDTSQDISRLGKQKQRPKLMNS